MTDKTETTSSNFHDVKRKVLLNDDKTMTVGREQYIPDSFLQGLAADREASTTGKMGNYHKVASIPAALVEKWKNEGFDIFDKNNSLKDILKRLQSQDFQQFIATERRI
jgi:hypothetical protein